MFDLYKVNTGIIKTHYEVAAIDESENYFQFVKYFDDYKDAFKFCEECNFKFDVYMTWGVNHCTLKIIKVTSEVM